MSETSEVAVRSAKGRAHQLSATIAELAPERQTNAEGADAMFSPLCRALAGTLAYGPGLRTIKVGKNRNVLVAGNGCDCFYANHNGWLFRYKILHKGGRQIIDFVLPGDIFALQACLFKSCLYSVSTLTPASLSVIPFDRVDQLLEHDPGLSKAIFWSAAREAARLAEHLTDAARRSAYERLSHLILELFVRLKTVGLTAGMSFHMPLTQELIGDALGLTTVHVNRTLRALRADNLIAIEGKRITILDFEALSRLSDFEASYLGVSASGVGAPRMLR